MRYGKLNRRTVLRGILGGTTASLALPCLEAMVDGNGVAYADGTAFPKRFGIWFWGCGILPDLWVPKGTGTNWTLPDNAILQPIYDNPNVKPHVSVVTGIEVKGGNSHYSVAEVLSGEKADAGYNSPTLDVVMTRQWQPKTKFPSLVLAVSRAHKPGEGFPNISANGRDNNNQPEYSPLKLFNRLFGTGLPDGGKAAQAALVLQARTSMLDTVLADANGLHKRLGASDRQRLDQHLDNLRTIERQLKLPNPSSCAIPTAPPDAPDKGAKEDLETIHRNMADLLALAFACDLTRIASLAFTTEETETIFWQVGGDASFHDGTTHHSDEGNHAEVIPKAMTFTMSQFAYLVEKLSKTQEGAGSLLDNCCIYATSGISDPRSHSNDETPILLAGRAGGKLKSGQHYRSTTKEGTSKVVMTMLRALDANMSSFGVGNAQSSETIGALEA